MRRLHKLAKFLGLRRFANGIAYAYNSQFVSDPVVTTHNVGLSADAWTSFSVGFKLNIDFYVGLIRVYALDGDFPAGQNTVKFVSRR